MTVKELEQRVIALEEEVKQLKHQRAAADGDRLPNWRLAVEKYRGDEDILAVLAEAMKLREKERRDIRKKQSKSRRS